MFRRRQINAGAAAPRLRSTVATAAGPVREAAWAVEERLVWRGADALKRIFDAARWPFERLAWVLEQRVVWPIQERTGEWNAPPLRTVGAIAAVLVAAGVASLLLLASGGSHETIGRVAVAKALTQPQPQPAVPAAPTLQGAPPLFAPTGGLKASPPAEAKAGSGHAAAAAPQADAASTASPAAPAEVAGPAAIAVAHRFSDAFVLYETGQTDAEVRSVFHATATPQLAAQLLRRPPRLPANVEVPRAKVLNLVPGRRLGGNCTVSVSLLRVGLTSELRLSMHLTKDSGWQVEEVLG